MARLRVTATSRSPPLPDAVPLLVEARTVERCKDSPLHVRTLRHSLDDEWNSTRHELTRQQHTQPHSQHAQHSQAQHIPGGTVQPQSMAEAVLAGPSLPREACRAE